MRRRLATAAAISLVSLLVGAVLGWFARDDRAQAELERERFIHALAKISCAETPLRLLDSSRLDAARMVLQNWLWSSVRTAATMATGPKPPSPPPEPIPNLIESVRRAQPLADSPQAPPEAAAQLNRLNEFLLGYKPAGA